MVAQSRDMLDDLLARTKIEGGLAMYVALVFDALKEREQALHWLERAYTEKDPFLVGLACEGFLPFRNVRPDPRFQQLLRRLGLTKHDLPRQRGLLMAAAREMRIA